MGRRDSYFQGVWVDVWELTGTRSVDALSVFSLQLFRWIDLLDVKPKQQNDSSVGSGQFSFPAVCRNSIQQTENSPKLRVQ